MKTKEYSWRIAGSTRLLILVLVTLSVAVLSAVPALAQADLQVFKNCKPDRNGIPLYASGSALCTIRVHNWGPADASSVKLTDVYSSQPGYFDLVLGGGPSCSLLSPNPQATSGTVTCDLGSIAAGAEKTALVGISSNDGLDINGTVTVTGSADPNTANNSAKDEVTFIPAADLALTMSAASATGNAGTDVTYDLSVTNNGPSTAQNVVIKDVLSAGVTIVSVTAEGSCIAGLPGNEKAPTTCNFGTMVSGASKSMQILVRVASSFAGLLWNNAEVSAATYDVNNKNNLATASTSFKGGPGK